MRDRANALQLVALLVTITRRLHVAGIKAISIKGPTLAAIAFGDASLRQCRDLDILIPPDQVERALAILQTDFRLIEPAGFSAPDQLHLWVRMMKDISLLHEPTGLIIELHWRLNANPYLMPATIEASRQAVTFGSDALETLAPVDLVLYLCVHGAKHYWFRLKWLADVHALLAHDDAEKIAQFYNHACSHGLDVPAGQMLLMLEEVYGVAIPPITRARAISSWKVRWSTRLALRYLHAVEEPGRLRLATTSMALGRLLLHRHPLYAVREVGVMLIDWPVALKLGGSRWTYVVAIIGRPVFWAVRKIKPQAT